jgi:hypothetical protein
VIARLFSLQPWKPWQLCAAIWPASKLDRPTHSLDKLKRKQTVKASWCYQFVVDFDRSRSSTKRNFCLGIYKNEESCWSHPCCCPCKCTHTAFSVDYLHASQAVHRPPAMVDAAQHLPPPDAVPAVPSASIHGCDTNKHIHAHTHTLPFISFIFSAIAMRNNLSSISNLLLLACLRVVVHTR